MPEADHGDVRDVIQTDAGDDVIRQEIEDVNDYLSEENALTGMSASRQRRLEKYAAALRIRETYDRPVDQSSVGNSSMRRGGTPISALRNRVSRLDPTGSLASMVSRDTSRNVNSTTQE